MKASKTEDRF